MKKELLRVQEVANMFSIGKSTVWLWVKQNKFPQPLHLSPRVSVWRLTELNNFIASAAEIAA